MIKGESQVSRKTANEDRIAICPQFGCSHLEKVKPLKFGVLGFRKYPKCSKHKIPLIFVDEFIGDFLCAVNACLFDFSSIPPKNLRNLIKTKFPNELITFINGWMYCNPIGRGAQIVSQYMDGLSRAYMKLLSWKQRKALKNEKSSTKRYNMLRLALKKIAAEYTAFLQELRENSEVLYDPENLHPLSEDMQKFLKKWLKDHLKTIKSLNNIEQSKSSLQQSYLSVLKREYDKVLHTGTCALLLGKRPSIVTKAVSSFELFSAYYELLKAGICRKITRVDVKSLIEETQEFLNDNEENLTDNQENEKKDFFNESKNMKDENKEYKKREGEVVKVLNINVLNFRQKVRNNLRIILISIKSNQKQKEIIWAKSLKILDEFISRAENNEFIIPKDAKPKVIAATIIYTVATSNERISKITMTKLEEITTIPKGTISSYYYRHFYNLFPRAEFHFGMGFKKIKNIISLYLFRKIMNNANNKTLSLLMDLKEKISKNSNSFEKLTQNDIILLDKMVNHHQDEFYKYFSDLVEVIRHLINLTRVHKKIGAKFSIKPLAYLLKKKGINLLHIFDTFYLSLIEIYDFLREQFPTFLPKRFKGTLPDKLSRTEYRTIIGNKIKLFVIKHIYDGLYLIDDKVKCPKCHKEGLFINTNDTRIASLEFHHKTKKKEYHYTARKLCRMFEKSNLNPYFLEDLIDQMESERVVVLCSVHHSLKHSKYYFHFRKIINWEDIPQKFPQDIFLLPNELIHILIWISVFNFYENKGLSRADLHSARHSIVKNLKKRYILKEIYGNRCPTCLEFNFSKHLISFDFHHLEGTHFDDNPFIHKKHRGEIKTASELYAKSYSCSEIVKILEYENGGYLCKNCHFVIQYSRLDLQLLNTIYEDKNTVKDILKDYNYVKKRFKLLKDESIIEQPLNKTIDINESLIRYLDAFYEISQQGLNIRIKNLMNYLGLSVGGVSAFFRRHWSFINYFIDTKYKDPKSFTSFKNTYVLTEMGKNYIELIYYFRDYYKNF